MCQSCDPILHQRFPVVDNQTRGDIPPLLGETRSPCDADTHQLEVMSRESLRVLTWRCIRYRNTNNTTTHFPSLQQWPVHFPQFHLHCDRSILLGRIPVRCCRFQHQSLSLLSFVCPPSSPLYSMHSFFSVSVSAMQFSTADVLRFHLSMCTLTSALGINCKGSDFRHEFCISDTSRSPSLTWGVQWNPLPIHSLNR